MPNVAEESPRTEGQRSKKAKFLPYEGKISLEKPDFYDEKGNPRSGKPESSEAFKPEPRYAVENGALVSYTIGRGGVRKRMVCSLHTTSAMKAKNVLRYKRTTALREQLRKAGIPGA